MSVLFTLMQRTEMSAILVVLVGLLLDLAVMLMVMRWARRQRRRRAIGPRLALLQNGLL